MTKLGSASRFGVRYGTPLKQIVRDIEEVQKKPQECPRCNRKAFLRRGFAKWECRKCGALMAGGAFAPRTELGQIVEQIVRRGVRLEAVQAPAGAQPAEASQASPQPSQEPANATE